MSQVQFIGRQFMRLYWSADWDNIWILLNISKIVPKGFCEFYTNDVGMAAVLIMLIKFGRWWGWPCHSCETVRPRRTPLCSYSFHPSSGRRSTRLPYQYLLEGWREGTTWISCKLSSEDQRYVIPWHGCHTLAWMSSLDINFWILNSH